MARILQLLPSQGNTNSKPLYEPQYAQCFRQIRIAVVRDARSTKVAFRHNSERPPGTQDLDAVQKPSDMHGCIGVFICPMHDCIVQQLLQCRPGWLFLMTQQVGGQEAGQGMVPAPAVRDGSQVLAVTATADCTIEPDQEFGR